MNAPAVSGPLLVLLRVMVRMEGAPAATDVGANAFVTPGAMAGPAVPLNVS
jgi:hypothetical protein